MLKFTIYCPILEKPTRRFAWFSRIVSGSAGTLILQLFGRDHFSFRQILRPWGGETPAIEQWGVRPPLPRGSSGGSPCGEGEVGGGGDDTSPWNPIRQRDSAGRWGVRQGLGLPRGAALAAHWVSHDRSLFPRLGTSLGPRRAPPPPYNAADGQSRVRPGRAGMGTVRPSSSAHCLSFFFFFSEGPPRRLSVNPVFFCTQMMWYTDGNAVDKPLLCSRILIFNLFFCYFSLSPPLVLHTLGLGSSFGPSDPPEENLNIS